LRVYGKDWHFKDATLIVSVSYEEKVLLQEIGSFISKG